MPAAAAGFGKPFGRPRIYRLNEMDVLPYITCHELIDFLYLYIENELPPERKAEFERHLTVCPSCQAYIQTYRDAIILEKRSFHDSAEALYAQAPEELVAAILASCGKIR